MRVFISHARKDRGWAEWIARQLERSDVDVELDSWHWPPGDDFTDRMQRALTAADAMVAVLSRSYFDEDSWTGEEWRAALLITKRRPGSLRPVCGLTTRRRPRCWAA